MNEPLPTKPKLTRAEVEQNALEQLIPHIPAIPVQPLLRRGNREDSLLFVYHQDYPWLLDFYRYDHLVQLSNQFDANIFHPAAEKAQKIAARQAMAVDIEARK